MPGKLKYNPKTKKKYKPIIKFNSGAGAILCNKCRIIIKENLTLAEFSGKTDLLFCNNCALELVKKRFK
jgi:hypothetical protein